MIKKLNEFMPDSLNGIKLYYQYIFDKYIINRSLLHGYISSNLNDYILRPIPKVMLFDCDDC